MNNTKKYVTIAAVLLCVCAAVYLNWSYNNSTVGRSELLDAELANAKSSEEMSAADGAVSASVSDYFAEARLTRQQSRDEALNLLKAAAAAETASQETIDGAMNAIAAMANYSMMETQIENLLLAKNFAECVAFISADGVTLAVPAPDEGLKAEDVAKITDTIVTETNFNPTQIKIIEVKSHPGGTAQPKSSGGKTENGAGSTASPGTASPGTASPGTTSPGTTSPGTTSPSTASPGTTSPNANQPNNSGTQPGTPNNSGNNQNNNPGNNANNSMTNQTMTDTGEVLE
ncbi:MAG: SpoIIIAH-like family protein [Oscillospiraceae bacterium]